MKITNFGSIESPSSPSKRSGAAPSGSFADLVSAAEASSVEGTSDISATSILSNLFALQEVPDEEVKRKKLLKRGYNLLENLEQLRRRLLGGSLPPQLLMSLSRELASQKQITMDPQINEIIEDIELRAAVELAKLQKALEDREERPA